MGVTYSSAAGYSESAGLTDRHPTAGNVKRQHRFVATAREISFELQLLGAKHNGR